MRSCSSLRAAIVICAPVFDAYPIVIMNWATSSRARSALLAALTISFGTAVWAQENAAPVVVSDAEVIVPVADRTVAARDAALRTALDAAVVRLAGERALSDFWTQPNAVLTSYQYRRAFDGNADTLKLQVKFDVAALRQALRDAGFSVWDARRPPVLLWVHAGSGWMDAVQAAREVPALMDRSQAWGFTLRFPQLDMGERQQVYATDIGAGSVARWMGANAAYGMPWALAVTLERAEAPQAASIAGEATVGEPAPTAEPVAYWTTQWTLADDRQILAQFELPPQPLDQATDAAWQRLNGLILEAEAFRRNTAPTQGWTLELVGLTDSRQYLQALAQLRDAEVPLRVTSLAPEMVQLAVEWKGTTTDLRRRALQWGWSEIALEPTPTAPPMYPGALQSYPAQPPEISRYRFSLPAP